MADMSSPNPTLVQKQRTTYLSPVNSHFLHSNNDQLERTQARAARAASIRRKPFKVNKAADANPTDKLLGREQIMELFQNCIKLASENKINQKNTWELNLIDHIFEIIKVEEENDIETNFQKASCTLEAGAKIYSMRVDSVHAEAYKVLGGLNRVGLDLEQDSVEDGNAENVQVKQTSRKEEERKLSPLSTLESSFDTLNVKKFDAAFTVDPLYHQTSAQFDEGGAKGLLLNNLGVYGGCRVLFDSLEVPGKCMSCSVQSSEPETIDISHARDSLEQMVLMISKNTEISPSLKDIVGMFDEKDRRPLDTFCFSQNPAEPDYGAYDNNNFDGDKHEECGTWDDEKTSPADEGCNVRNEEPFIPNYYEGKDEYVSLDPGVDEKSDGVDDFMFLSLGSTFRKNAWAGPDHWKYQKAKGPDGPANENGSPSLPKKPSNKKPAEFDIEFMKALDTDMGDLFAPPQNSKSLLLPANREPGNTTLPEDCHYQPENLVKFFLLPNVMCLGKRERRHTDTDELHREEVNGALPSSDDDYGVGDQYDDGNAYSDVEDSSTLIAQPRQVEKIEVQYDRKSKQVDVHLLKECLWSSVQEMQKSTPEETLSFKEMLASFPTSNKKPACAYASIDDVSPHLCFICLLHLANEHGLSFYGSPNLDDIGIHPPTQH